jgi:hypothetical protein
MAAVIDLKLIDPKRHEKYSPNLFRWLRKWKKESRSTFGHLGVYVDKDGREYVGEMRDAEWLHGSRLGTILCDGGRAMVFACAPSFGFKPVQGFWDRYVEIGRCAIDTKHNTSFQNSDGRYLISEDGYRAHLHVVRRTPHEEDVGEGHAEEVLRVDQQGGRVSQRQMFADPANYRAMLEPHESVDAANEAANAFFEGVAELRKNHRLPNVLIVADVHYLAEGGTETPGRVSSFLGDVLHAEELAAYAHGYETARRQERIGAMTRMVLQTNRTSAALEGEDRAPRRKP